MRYLVALSVSVLAVAVGLSLIVFADEGSRDDLLESGTSVQAVVTGQRAAVSRSAFREISYRFDGNNYEGSFKCSDCPSVDDEVTIFVDPEAPERFATPMGDTRPIWVNLGWLIFLSGAFILLISMGKLAYSLPSDGRRTRSRTA